MNVKGQRNIILGLIFALLVALFSIANIQNVEVNYIVGYFETPLVIVILGSVTLGALIVFLVGGWKFVKMRNYTKKLEKEMEQLRASLPEEEVATTIENVTNENDHSKPLP
ncbi:lipopolysaccharide assembly protein LapA domain-containing protein [Anoxybacillus sp. LAT_35]|uniref:LapA family protein n=1 Tax=unclassified Anoxybacillus TaxID=2639704 RepID=UPI001ED9C867|nr:MULTISPECIES: lipopolysaccharide assembly protein LapA domain-containing protein [unclassified Anoxybacillus]MCG5026707.1 lipopolysaccharide assembly protein LapA domain-containing protein [Anoxybacillus flavithermus]MCG6196982.1 lipopolysaccharide assembly protein LapA domain-containing protein [Anoxybacillus sp. LAT_38]MCG3083218.1 lipopolysaccharide assembly protein LapA domain-containing protein [Anoxybacillus sp. LAT27]MCG3084509.1 lipopolysaccharide assembly protein LapA domain-contain